MSGNVRIIKAERYLWAAPANPEEPSSPDPSAAATDASAPVRAMAPKFLHPEFMKK